MIVLLNVSFEYLLIYPFQFSAKHSCRKLGVTKVKFKVKYAVRNLEVSNHKLNKTTIMCKCLKHVMFRHEKGYFGSYVARMKLLKLISFDGRKF